MWLANRAKESKRGPPFLSVVVLEGVRGVFNELREV